MKGSKLDIQTGQILLAEPFMLDGNFKHSVVLLCDHTTEGGTLGLILNKETEVMLNDLVSEFPEINAPIYLGGPVAQETIQYIHNVGDLLEGSIEIAKDVWWGGDFEQLKMSISLGLITEENIRFFVGYAGWESGQLDMEMEMKSWFLSDMKHDYLFADEPLTLWKKCMADKGDTFSILSEIPASKAISN